MLMGISSREIEFLYKNNVGGLIQSPEILAALAALRAKVKGLMT
jgi:hypothetical protein